MSNTRTEPPDWWKFDLYDFTSEMPLEGWVWEFMRRSRLKKIYGDETPIEAMNPIPDLDNINPDHFNYFKLWNHDYWFEGKGKNRKRVRLPYYVPPAVNIPGQWPRGFHGQQYRLDGEPYIMQIPVDIRRSNASIMKSMEAALNDLRKRYSEIESDKSVRPLMRNWRVSYYLEVWDLRELGIKMEVIDALIGKDIRKQGGPRDDQFEGARITEALRSVREYIEGEKWKVYIKYISENQGG